MGVDIYAMAFLVSILMLILLIAVGYRQNITFFLMVFIAITISDLGYYITSSSEFLETAIMGQKLTYLGAVFIPILMLFCTMKLCHIDIPKILVMFLVTFSLIVLYFAASVQSRDDYYKRVTLQKKDGMTYLIKEYGPMHILYMILIFGCLIFTMGIIGYSFFSRRSVSYKVILSLILAEIATAGCYIWRRISDGPIEWIVIAYLIDEILILILIRRIGMYEVSESIAKSLNEHSTYGYLVFDKKKRYVGCNAMADQYIPEISDLKIDEVLNREKTPILYDNFEKWLENPEEEKCKCLIKNDEQYLKCSLKKLYYGQQDNQVGFLIEITDDTQQQKYMNLLNNYNADLEDEVQKKTEHISVLQDKIVLGMADMIEDRDSNTGGHIKRTSEVIKIFTSELQKYEDDYEVSKEFLNYVVKAAPMHDLGKIAVDDRILRKPGKYTSEEYEEMKKHSEKGAKIVNRILAGVEDEQFLTIAENVAHYHHEKWNGEGYPDNIAGKKIPLEARIMALADVFDALVSKRCYKDKMDYDTAFKIIEESLGSHFDPELGKLFLNCREQLERFYDMVENDVNVTI